MAWTWDRWAKTPVFAAGARVMLREEASVIAVDRGGAIAWRLTTPASAVMVGLPDGSVAVAADDSAYVIERDGRQRAAQSLPATVLAGAPGGPLGDVVWAVGTAQVAIVRGDAVTLVDLQGRHLVRPEQLTVDPQGRLWQATTRPGLSTSATDVQLTLRDRSLLGHGHHGRCHAVASIFEMRRSGSRRAPPP